MKERNRNILYFGKRSNDNGHVLHWNDCVVYHIDMIDMPKDLPMREGVLDGGLLPQDGPQPEGLVTYLLREKYKP